MDRLSDMVSRIKNGQQRKRLSVEVVKSRFCSMVLDCLTREGFIRGYSESDKYTYIVFLKYKDSRPVIEEFKRISKQSRRVYLSAKELRRNYFNNDLIIYTSPKGVFLNSPLTREGGEALVKIR